MKLERQLLQRLLDMWKKIKELRRSQGYTATSVRLLIKQWVSSIFANRAYDSTSLRRISGKKNKQYEQMQKQIEEEIQDEIVLADEEYQRARAAHSDIVKKRKLQNIRKVN